MSALRRADPRFLGLLGVAFAAGLGCWQDISEASYADTRSQLAAHLDDEVLPYWTSAALARQGDGGVPLLGIDLRPSGEVTRHLIPQLRRLFVYALARERTTDPQERERLDAEIGALLDSIEPYWDPGGDGFYAEPGGGARQGTKLLAHGIQLLSEVTLRSGSAKALSMARRAAAVVEARGRDELYGGYFEHLELPPDDPHNDVKSLSVHMHLLLGLTRLEQAAPAPAQRARLETLLDLVMERFEVDDSGRIYEALDRRWRELPEDLPDAGRRTKVVHPHGAELIIHVLEAAAVLGRAPDELAPWVRRVAGALRTYGIDGRGAVRHTSSYRGAPEDLRTFWWSQAETLAALLLAYELLDEAAYWHAFERVHGFTFARMVPPGSAAWVSTLDASGKRVRGMRWQTGFHVARSLASCEAALARLLLGRSR